MDCGCVGFGCRCGESYLLFKGEFYYPSGGWNDFKSRHSTLEEALEAAANSGGDWWHIVDTQSLKVVRRGRRE